MRHIRFERLLPRGGTELCEVDILSFVRTEGYLASFVSRERKLPPIDELNRVLGKGRGDDGFVIMKWTPFTVDQQEYSKMDKAVRSGSSPGSGRESA